MNMRFLLLSVGLGLAGSAQAALPNYIGSITNNWATTNAVIVTAGTTNDFAGNYWPTNIINGGAFAAATGPDTKPGFDGATYNTDGITHSYSVTDNGWLGNCQRPSGLPHPSGRATTNDNNYARNWLSFHFDKPYEVLSFDIWNGSYCGAPGGGGDFAFKDVYIDYKTNGVWAMAQDTIKIHRPWMYFFWFPPTDNVQVNLKDVTDVVITPVSSWAEDPSWYADIDPTYQPYFTVKACVSEIRFYTPSVLPLTVTNQGSSVTISWPTTMPGPITGSSFTWGWSTVSASGYILQSTDNLIGGTWSPVNGVVDNSVTILNPTGTRFYRLSR